MKLIVKIGLIALLVMLNYQGVDADVVSSAIDRYATTTESQENTPSDHGTLETMSFTTSLLTGQQQVLTKLVPDDLRIRRAEELQQNFLKILIGRFSLREELLAIDRAKIFPSNPIHCVPVPAGCARGAAPVLAWQAPPSLGKCMRRCAGSMTNRHRRRVQ